MLTTDLGACEWFVWDLRRSNLIDRGQLDQIIGEFLSKNPGAEPHTSNISPSQMVQLDDALDHNDGKTAGLVRWTEQTNTGVTTIKTWLTECPAFRQRISEARAELSARVMGRIAGGMVTAIDTLERLCGSKSETTQLRSAEALLTHGTALSEVAQLKTRMDDLERAR